MSTSEEVIRNEIEEGLEDSETSMIVAIEFAKAFTYGVDEREIYHVVLTHEYSTETELEVLRVIIDNKETIKGMERVFKS